MSGFGSDYATSNQMKPTGERATLGQIKDGSTNNLRREMTVFTEAEVEFLSSRTLGRIATASVEGQPDVSPVGYRLDGQDIPSGGLDLTKTIRYRHLKSNPRAAMVVDDQRSDPPEPRGIKVRGEATLEEHDGALTIRVRPTTVWSWGINHDAPTYFAGSVEKRQVQDG